MMRRMIGAILLGMAFLLPQGASAQNFGGGLSVGFLAAQLDGDQFGGYKKLGLHFGGFTWYDINDRIALQMEILYQNKGARETEFADYNRNFHYLDVPLLVKVMFAGDKQRGYYAHAGLAPGYLVSAQLGFQNLKSDDTDIWNRFSTDFMIGATAQFTPNWGLMARWGYSLLNIGQNRRPWFTNHYFNFALRYRFNKG